MNWRTWPLEKMNTHQLLHLLNEYRKWGCEISGCDCEGPFPWATKEAIKAELSKRPHVKRRAERRG